jgi:DNA-binding MarR family transcriptional regulator
MRGNSPKIEAMALTVVAAKTGAEFDVANRVFFRLYQASNLMHKQGTRYVGNFGTTTQQWAVLGALARPLVRDSGMTVKELIEFLEVSRQNLTAVLDRLEGRRWIRRVKDKDDGRSRRIRLTAEGKSTWIRMLEPIEAFYAAALTTFGQDDQVMLYRLLDRLKTALTKV